VGWGMSEWEVGNELCEYVCNAIMSSYAAAIVMCIVLASSLTPKARSRRPHLSVGNAKSRSFDCANSIS